MNAIRVETITKSDGELHLTHLPCHKGDRADAILLMPASPSVQEREVALQEFLKLADESKFCSQGPYPTRDELHERGTF